VCAFMVQQNMPPETSEDCFEQCWMAISEGKLELIDRQPIISALAGS
jgi:hypothetical protein